MLLSVPLTMIIKIMLENSEQLRWVGILLGPAEHSKPRAAETSGSTTGAEPQRSA